MQGHTYANSRIEVEPSVDGAAQAPDDINSVIPISTGYGIAGAEVGGQVTVSAAALSALGDGTYSVILLGIGGDGSVVALDQKEVAIGSENGGAALYYESDNTDWSELDISKTRKVLTVKDSKAADAIANLNAAEIVSHSGAGSETGGKGATI